MTATLTPAAPAVDGSALGRAAARLADLLADRVAHGGDGVPVVVPLGAADVTDPAGDPHRDRRAAATVHLTADQVLVGPFGGGRDEMAPCGRCLALRWQALRTRSHRDALETGTATHRASADAWPLVPAFVADATGLLLQALPGPGADRPGVGLVAALDQATGRVTLVELLADPACPACPASTVSTGSTLQGGWAPAARPRPAGSGARLRAASSYPLAEDALVNPVCGVLGPGTVPDLVSPTTAAVSGRFVERGRGGLHDLGWSGKAASFADSRRLALLEGLERYAGTRPRGAPPVVVDTLAGLGDAALDPRACGEYPPASYGRDPVLRRFSPDAAIPWVRGYSLRDDRELLVPLRTAYYGRGSDVDDFAFECSNGCATGSCLEEAVLCGLLELVERDAFLLAWYGGAELTGVDPATVPSAEVRRLASRADLHGYDVRLLDNRVDLSVPVLTAVVSRRDGGLGLVSYAAAAALDPARAAEAALEEALTYLPHLAGEVARRRDEVEAMAEDFDLVTELRHHALLSGLPRMSRDAARYLTPARTVAFTDVFDAAPAVSADLLDDLRRCVDEVAAAGCDVVAVDQTTPEQADAGLRTARVVAPGLLPIDFGWGRQRALQSPRLRTAFARAGWRSGPLTEADLHRVPHPFP